MAFSKSGWDQTLYTLRVASSAPGMKYPAQLMRNMANCPPMGLGVVLSRFSWAMCVVTNLKGKWERLNLRCHQEADVVLGGFAMDYERSRVIDYSAPILHSETALLMRAPSREQSKPFVMVTRPFSGDVWMVICASVIGSGVLLKGLTDYLKDEGEIHYGWTTAIWVFYSIFVQQSKVKNGFDWFDFPFLRRSASHAKILALSNSADRLVARSFDLNCLVHRQYGGDILCGKW